MDIKDDLLRWFKASRRELPWRTEPTPYSVWISEVMLQQTVVAAVVPYFIRWMERFPTVRELSVADEREVLRMWEGLGYYSRARNIRKAASVIVEQHNGILPRSYEELIALPGIGDYTASAIMSLSYGKRYVVLDANVKRIAQRMRRISDWNSKVEADVRRWLFNQLDSRRPDMINEALMELGELICRPRDPDCSICPLSGICEAFARGVQHEIPARKTTVKISKRTHLAVVRSGDAVLLATPSESGRFHGLWSIPAVTSSIAKACAEVSEITGEKVTFTGKLPSQTHFYTKYRDRLYPKVFTLPRRSTSGSGPDGYSWVHVSEIEEYPVPSIHRVILKGAFHHETD